MFRGVENLFFAGTTEFDYKKLDDARIYLRDFEQTNLATIEDHKGYVELVSKFRTLIEEVTKQNGDRFLETIKRLLSVGDDGLYTNRMRFLFELIQNVDDCDYAIGVQPKLTINFDVDNRRLILRYNELGFTPRNVFAITGIAEEAKNIDERKLQIGEKGIGFKSVFGVANSVLIRSGLFSFRLNRNHFTIPIPEYTDGFSGIEGTELTLEFDSDDALGHVMDSMMERYRKDNALFTQNPIVFLNKLNGLEFKAGDEQLLSFSITRPPSETEMVEGKSLTMCRGMTLALHRKGRPDRPISGTCYTTMVRYSKEDCQSRYGTDTRLETREMKIEAFFPDSSYVIGETGRGSIEHGLMYSFLPTQVELEVPIICHAPFKLDASREYVDSQFRNAWFRRTMTALSAFIHSCYRIQAADVHESIIAYVPKYSKNFFVSKNNSKMDDLLKSEYGLGGDAIGREKIFYCKNDGFYAASEVESFVKCEEVEQPLELLRLCGNTRPFFCSPVGFFPGGYNMHYIEAPYDLLFSTVFGDEDVGLEDARKAVEIVKKKKPWLIRDACKDGDFNTLNANHLVALSEVGELRSLIDTLVQRVRRGQSANFIFHRTDGHMRSVFELIGENSSVGYEDMGAHSASYFKSINGYCLVLNDVVGDGFCIPADNVCVVAGGDCAAGLIDLCRKFDPDSLFSVRLKLKNASVTLDAAMTTDNPREFLVQLRNIRMASKDAMGDRAYKSYLDLIQKSGISTGRYVNELLQNADDCDYADGVLPSAEISVDNGVLVLSTNEVGFKANNVRAITAIGESTKNILLSAGSNRLTIGEKGVGFKSIFAIADSVEVHSGGFDFVLNAGTPTIPILIPEVANQVGTIMRLKLKDDFSISAIDEQEVLDLCVCLRKLRRIKLYEYDVQIEDDGSSFRRVTINGVAHEFLVCEHEFQIRDARALAARNVGGKRLPPDQKIRCYVPTTIRRYEYPLYCGLPIRSWTCSPIIVDAPFELTTARDAVLEDSRWNGYVLENVYAGIIKTADLIKDQLRINVLHLFGVESAETRFGTLCYKAKMFKGFGEEFLNNTANFIDRVRCAEVIPVKSSPDVFLCPEDVRLRVFPEFLSRLYDDVELDCPFERVDFSGGQQIEHLRDVLGALTVRGLDEDEFWKVIDNLGSLSELMGSKEFCSGLYAFLRRLKNVESASCHPIVPVVTENGTRFVCEDEGRFFFSEERRVSTEKYYIVDTEILDRKAYEDIFDDELKEMNDAQELSFYKDQVIQFILNHAEQENYRYLLSESIGCNAKKLQECWPNIERNCRGRIPLRNRAGEIIRSPLFLSKHIGFVGRFSAKMIVHDEALYLARLMECEDFANVSYDNLLEDPWTFTSAEIDDFMLPYFKNGDDILLLAVKKGRISPDLADRYGLTLGLASSVNANDYEFPEEPIDDFQRLKCHINEQIENPVKIVSRTVERVVQYGKTVTGSEFALDSKECRSELLVRYAPVGVQNVCFCQMCCKPKRTVFIEVNNIELKPEHYWKQLRVSLCLECSKRFELLRQDLMFRNDLMRRLECAHPSNDQDNVQIRFPVAGGEQFSMVFTRTHLAEIQEILKARMQIQGLR